jgi:hypothetical protein
MTTTRNLTIRVSPEFHARWMKYLKANNLNGSALVRMLVEDRLQLHESGLQRLATDAGKSDAR